LGKTALEDLPPAACFTHNISERSRAVLGKQPPKICNQQPAEITEKGSELFFGKNPELFLGRKQPHSLR
jgi:hypothetical protein